MSELVLATSSVGSLDPGCCIAFNRQSDQPEEKAKKIVRDSRKFVEYSCNVQIGTTEPARPRKPTARAPAPGDRAAARGVCGPESCRTMGARGWPRWRIWRWISPVGHKAARAIRQIIILKQEVAGLRPVRMRPPQAPPAGTGGNPKAGMSAPPWRTGAMDGTPRIIAIGGTPRITTTKRSHSPARRSFRLGLTG
ncbi:MAG: hypothetical protein JWM91_20 [Rhodospirillales bacterium]|nr:hypothetical protein [Rhodospirillales bacterium]